MIGIVDVIRACSGALEELFGAPPTTKDLVEVTDRPCSYVQAETSTERDGGLRHDAYHITITYFAPYHDRGYLDLLKAQEKLAARLIQPVEVDERFHLLPEEVEIQPIREEMILVCDFSAECRQDEPLDDWRGGSDQDMDALDVNDEAWVRPDDD